MSPKCYKKARWLIFLFIGFAASASSQNVIATTTGTCSNVSDGSISMELDSALLDNYPLPYAAEWENITDGEYGTFHFIPCWFRFPNRTPAIRTSPDVYIQHAPVGASMSQKKAVVIPSLAQRNLSALMGLCSCQRNVPVSSEGKTLSNQVKESVQLANKIEKKVPTILIDTVKDTVNYDSIPFRRLPLSEQLKRSQPFHQYGNIKLKRYNPNPTYYSFTNEKEGYMVIENYPGVLHYRYVPSSGRLRKPYTCYKLEFYDPVTEKYRKSIDLIKGSPYNKDEYPIVGYGYPSMEDFTWDFWAGQYEKGEDAFYDLLNTRNPCYLTVNNVNARPNGFTIVEYQLIEMSKKAAGPLDWEETLVVFDSLGNELNRLTVPNDTQDAWVSNDGQFIIYIYGGTGSCNPNDIYDGGVKIFDFKENKVVFQRKNNDENGWFNGISGSISYGVEDIIGDDLFIISFYKKNNHIKWLIDFPNRIVNRVVISSSEQEGDCPPNYKFSTYRQLLSDCSLQAEKF